MRPPAITVEDVASVVSTAVVVMASAVTSIETTIGAHVRMMTASLYRPTTSRNHVAIAAISEAIEVIAVIVVNAVIAVTTVDSETMPVVVPAQRMKLAPSPRSSSSRRSQTKLRLSKHNNDCAVNETKNEFDLMKVTN